MNHQNIWDSLVAKNLVTGEKPTDDHIHIPWYIRFIQGFSGWLAALFIMGFFAVFFGLIFNKPTGGLVVSLGLLCSVGGYVLIRMQKNDFIDQLGMAFSLSGQLIFAIGLFLFLKIGWSKTCFVLGVYQLILAWVIPQYAHRLLSTAFGFFALLIALNSAGYYGIGSALIAVLLSFIWIKENRWGKLHDLWEPIGLGVALTIVFSSGFLITGKFLFRETFRETTGWLFENAELVSSILIALVFLNLVIVLLKEYKVKLDSRTAILGFIAATGLILISFKVYGLSTGLLIVLIGFARQRIVLIVLGAMSVASFFSWYYYNLQATLLFKSVVLIVLGLATLTAWFVLNYIYKDKSHDGMSKFKLRSLAINKAIGIVTIVIALIAINMNINKKEDLIANGESLLFKLAPVDPRSIMQGDYMRLRFDIEREIIKASDLWKKENSFRISDGIVVVEKGLNNVASYVSIYKDQAIQENQRLIPFKIRGRKVIFTTNAFYFQEGKADHFQQAEYGEFKLSEDGEILLVHMIDKDLKIL